MASLNLWKKMRLPNQASATFSPAQKDKFTGLAQNHCVLLIAAVGILAGAWAIWKAYLSLGIKVVSVNRMQYILSDKPSIAVLPFVNLSEDHGQEFFQ